MIKEKTPVSRNSVLEKVETQILPAWWLLIWGTQVEVLGIPFPFCVLFSFFYPISYTLCTANLHPELVRNTQDWWITCKAPSQAHSPKRRKCIFPPDLTQQRQNISWDAWLTHGHLQKLIPRNKLSSCCHPWGSQQIPWSLHHHHTLDSSTWTPSTGWEGKGAFPEALPAMPSVNSPLYQEPLLVLLALRMHNLMTWVITQEQWLLNKENFPRKLKGLAHI